MDIYTMKEREHKVTDGKMLQVKAEIESGTIRAIKITGDFFIHPESAIDDIEAVLTGMQIIDVEQELHSFLVKRQIQIIGFGVSDLIGVLKELAS